MISHIKPSAHQGVRTAPSRLRSIAPMLLFGLLPLLAGCPEEPKPTPSFQDSPVHMVVLGDSLSAGHQSGCTIKNYVDLSGRSVLSQDNGYAYVIAKQAGWDLKPPYISEPGARPCLVIEEDYNLLTVHRKPVPDPDGILPEGDPNDARTWGTRLAPGVKTRNLSSPGTRIVDIFGTPDNTYHPQFGLDYLAMWTLFADTPDRNPDHSLLKQAEGLLGSSYADPTVAIMWLGSNDALWSALGGTDQAMTPALDFDFAAYFAIAALAGSGARVYVGTVPDLTVAPHFMPAGVAAGLFLAAGPPPYPEISVDTPVEPGCTFSQLTGLLQEDYVVMSTGLPEIGATLQAFLGGAGCGDNQLPEGPPPAIPDVVLRAAEVAVIQARIDSYNASLTAAATAYGATLVDIAGLLSTVAASGYVVGTETLYTGYCEGIFSLDGVHPSNMGYAAVANEFIRAINTSEPFVSIPIPEADEVAIRAAEPRHNRCLAALP